MYTCSMYVYVVVCVCAYRHRHTDTQTHRFLYRIVVSLQGKLASDQALEATKSSYRAVREELDALSKRYNEERASNLQVGMRMCARACACGFAYSDHLYQIKDACVCVHACMYVCRVCIYTYILNAYECVYYPSSAVLARVRSY